MRKIIYALLVLLAIVAVSRVIYEYRNHGQEIAANTKFKKHQMAIRQKGAPKVQMLDDIKAIEKIFYPALATCTPTNLADNEGVNYVIYGEEGNKCSFEKYDYSYSLKCNVPMKVAEQYAISGQTSKKYIDEVNNNDQYCQLDFDRKKKKTKKKKNYK